MPRPETPRELRDVIHTERVGVPFLLLRDADGVQQLVPLKAGMTPVTVGRRSQNTISLGWDTQASRTHAQLDFISGDWVISDDGLSINGTFLNGSKLGGRQRLRDGDLIRIGTTGIAFRAPGDASGALTTPGGDRPTLADLTDTQRSVLLALCRPMMENGQSTIPATNKEIGAEIHLGVDAVKGHMRILFRKFDLEGLKQNEKRFRLVQVAMQLGLVSQRDYLEGEAP